MAEVAAVALQVFAAIGQAAGTVSEFVATTATAIGVPSSIAAAAANTVLALGGQLGLTTALQAWSTVAALSGALSPKIAAAKTGGPVTMQLNPDAGLPVVFGRTATGGFLVYRDTWGGNANKFLGLQTVLCAGGPVDAIESSYVAETAATFSGSPPAHTGAYAGVLWQYLGRLGAVPETAQTIDSGTFGVSYLPGQGSSSALSGCASVISILKHSDNKWPRGVERLWHVVRGIKAWDPRLDSTWPGGSGTHRWADPSSPADYEAARSTWAYTRNPYLLALQWLLGRWERGTGLTRLVKVWGCGIPVAGIDVAAFVAGARTSAASGWYCDGTATTEDDKFEVLRAILQAGGGVPLNLGGTISCYVRAPRAGVFMITADDLAGQVQVIGAPARKARYNRVTPKYRSESHKWQVVAADAVAPAAYLAEDRGARRSYELTLPMVQSATQATRLAALDLAETREAPVFKLVVKPRLRYVRVGDAGHLNVPGLRRWADEAPCKVVVIDREVDAFGSIVSLTLRAETDAKYADALALSGSAPPAPTTTDDDPTNVPAPGIGAWTPAGATIAGAGSSAEPAVVLNGANDYDFTRTVVVEFKKAADVTWMVYGEFAASVTRIELTGLASNTAYSTRVSYRSALDVVGPPRTLADVTAGVAAPPDGSVTTAKAASGAITQTAFTYGYADHTLVNSNTTVTEINDTRTAFTTVGGKVLVDAELYMQLSSGDDLEIYIGLDQIPTYSGGGVVNYNEIRIKRTGTSSTVKESQRIKTVFSGVAAGSHTVYVAARNMTNASVTFKQRMVTVDEFRDQS